MMRSNSFDTQEVREIGREEAGESRGFFILDRADSLREEQLGKLGEPAIEHRREYTVFGFNLGEREEQVVCHASALALAMTD